MPPIPLFIHCVDRIYRDTPSARIDRLIPIWRPPAHGKKNLSLTAACIWLSHGGLNPCLIPIWKQPSDSRLHTAASRYIEQPPHSRLHTAAWRVKKHLYQNSCLTAFSQRLSCGEFQQKLFGGGHDSGYVGSEYHKWHFPHEAKPDPDPGVLV